MLVNTCTSSCQAMSCSPSPSIWGKASLKRQFYWSVGARKLLFPAATPQAWHCWLCQVDQGKDWADFGSWGEQQSWGEACHTSGGWMLWGFTLVPHTPASSALHMDPCGIHLHTEKYLSRDRNNCSEKKKPHVFKRKLGKKVHSYWSIVHLPTAVLQGQ